MRALLQFEAAREKFETARRRLAHRAARTPRRVLVLTCAERR